MSVRVPVVAAARHLSMAQSSAVRGAHAAVVVPSVASRGGAAPKSAAFPRRRRHGMTVVPRAGWNDFEWGSAKVVSNKPACKEGGLHSIVVQVDAEMAKGYTKPGMFIQMRCAEVGVGREKRGREEGNPLGPARVERSPSCSNGVCETLYEGRLLRFTRDRVVVGFFFFTQEARSCFILSVCAKVGQLIFFLFFITFMRFMKNRIATRTCVFNDWRLARTLNDLVKKPKFWRIKERVARSLYATDGKPAFIAIASVGF